MIFGTPEYMSPEQAAGKDLDHRVDVYALGIILYECIAGQVPYEGDTFMGVLTQHLFGELPSIRDLNPEVELSDELDLVIQKALAKDREERYFDTAELAEAIEAALEGRLSPATAAAPPMVTAPKTLSYLDLNPNKGRARWAWAAAIAVALVALGWGTLRPSPEGSVNATAARESIADDRTPTAAVPSSPSELVVESGMIPAVVPVHVATDPSGATVFYGNGGRACESTPCTLEAEMGSTLVLRAKLGKRRGRTAITPTDEQTVLIELNAPRKPAPTTASSSSPPKKRPPTSRSSDLKVPAWAQ
jgi:serine/threonine-protein kinase